MSKDDDTPLHRTDSFDGYGEAYLVGGEGGGYPPGDAGFEAPKKPRTTTQIAAFEKARAKRNENLAKKSWQKARP